MNIDLEKEDIDELIDALTGRIAYYKRYAGNDRFAHLRMKQCEKLRERFNTLLKNANYSIIWIAKEELEK